MNPLTTDKETGTVLVVESGEEATRKQEIHEIMLQELQEARRTRDLYATQLSQAQRKQLTDSLKFENIKKHLSNMLSGMEAYHAQNGKFESWEQANEYCEAAKAARQLGRKGDLEPIVSEQMKTM